MGNYFSPEAFINTIRQLRDSGLSSREIAAQFSISYQTVDRWLAGKINLDNLRLKAWRIVMGDPYLPERSSLSVHADKPAYAIRAALPETMTAHIRMLRFIHDRDPDRWKALAAIIESVHRDIGGGRRGRRQKTGD